MHEKYKVNWGWCSWCSDGSFIQFCIEKQLVFVWRGGGCGICMYGYYYCGFIQSMSMCYCCCQYTHNKEFFHKLCVCAKYKQLVGATFKQVDLMFFTVLR